VSALDYDRTVLDPRDLSYERQLAQLEAEGWELEDASGSDQPSTFRYLRRHRRIAEIERLFEERGQKLRLRREDDGTWTAGAVPGALSSSSAVDPEATWATPLEAVEAAWEQFGSSG
jgi:hypothetical protein